ncbi:hypothetical protein NMG60_11026164 [Bertholletia excelsa]
MPSDLDNSSTVNGSAVSGDSSPGNQTVPPNPPKKKRNLPGMPDPDAEVIALSPKTLLATNRFVCEICSKGFQRDQNLQLHRRGHNLPWKLRQRSSKDVRKRVYVCPESTCVHHYPTRALGDLTGIKKHYCRKHGEKKWKCEKCSKKYAVQSDWKAHSKVCGTREYKCDCGTLFSRRDSFITHRAFCDALAEESAKAQSTAPAPAAFKDPKAQTTASTPPPALPATTLSPSTSALSSILPIRSPDLPDNSPIGAGGLTGSCNGSSSSSSNGSTRSSVFGPASLFASSTSSASLPPQTVGFTDLIQAMARHGERIPDLYPMAPPEPFSLCLSTNHGASGFGNLGQERRQYAPPPPPTMSATALLQKAAQMGATATNASLLRGLGLGVVLSASSSSQQIEPECGSPVGGLGLGIASDSGLKELMMGTPSMFGPKQTTLDLLGLGRAGGGAPTGGLSALMSSITGGLDVAAAAATFGGGEFSGKDMGKSS